MTNASKRPEPGIATDEELREAAQAIKEVLDEELVYSITCNRFGTAKGISGDDTTEIITVRLSNEVYATKETVINDVLSSSAPVRLCDLETDDEKKLTFYPTNQDE